MTINLIDQKCPNVVITKFSDGQLSANITIEPCSHIFIKTRINSNDKLMELLCVYDAIRSLLPTTPIYVEIGYLLGGRSDRRFAANQSFDLKIISKIINSCNFHQVRLWDVHSDVTLALIDRSENIPPLKWLRGISYFDSMENKVLVTPDAGAFKKGFELQKYFNCGLATGSKVRLSDGSPTTVINGDLAGKDCFIVDDICDGGRTFVSLAKQLKELGAKTVTLFVTHGIFSYGLELDGLDSIYTTNSYRDFTESLPPNFHVINIFQ